MSDPRISLIGYGEVGQVLAADLHGRGHTDIRAWDILFPRAESLPARALARGHVQPGSQMSDALSSAALVICAVTAGESLAAARSAAPHLRRDAFYVDLNSVAPQTKREIARIIEAAGARFVEAAVMAPVGPKRIASPMLLGGSHAAALLPLADSLGFTGMQIFSPEIGRASAAKMCRSVMIKGLEALLTESLLTARQYGVEKTVIASLDDLLPVGDWRKLARYMISRSLQHGTRRAEEMQEVAQTVADTGLTPWMSTACAQRQRWAGRYAAASGEEELNELLDAVLELAQHSSAEVSET